MMYSAVITMDAFVTPTDTFYIVFHTSTSFSTDFLATALPDALTRATGLHPRCLPQ